MVIVIHKRVHRNPERIQREMEEAFRSIMSDRPQMANRQSGRWRPHLEVYETEEGLSVVAELAGVDEKTLEITADAKMVSISGERHDSREQEHRRYRETGITYGPFSASVYLPFAVDLRNATADYEHGLLQIELPRVLPTTVVPRRTSRSESN